MLSLYYLNTLSLHKAENISSTTKSSWILFCTFYSLAEVRINVLMMIQLILVQSPHFDFNINDILFSCAMGIHTYCYVYYINQGGGIPLQSVLQAVTTVKISQLEIFSIVNSQATISL